MATSQPIRQGSRVVLHLSLSLEDGTEVVSTFGGEPLELTLGEGAMEQALETRLLGLKPGEERTLLLSGNEVYGPWDEGNRHWIEAGDFPPSLALSEGQIISFSMPQGEVVAGQVAQIEPSRVLIDFNHPLSGRGVVFRTCVLAVDPQE